jgi:acyl-CoA thioester hydrolase
LNRNPDFQTAINVRFNDIDAMGHVNNAVMFTYFEEGRKALFLERLKGVKGGGFNFILAHIQCDYLLPVRLEDRPVLKMTVSAIGGKSFGLSYVLVDSEDDRRIFAKGSSVQVCYDYHQGQSIPVPEDLRKRLAAYLEPS